MIAVLLALLAGAGFLLLRSDSPPAPAPPPQDPTPEQDAGTTEEQIQKLCSTCHLQTPPEVLPRHLWDGEIRKMYEFVGMEGVTDKEIPGVPPVEDTIRYYTSRAPLRVAGPETYLGQGPGPVKFVARGLQRQPVPGVSFLRHVRLLDETRKDLIASDMRTGEVLVMQPYLEGAPVRKLAQMEHPCRAQVVDLDGDGHRDLLVAELGSLLPEDHRRGKVVWLRGLAGGGFTPVTLIEDVGRVADVSAGDTDGDGDLDIVVAVFGWRTTGKLLWLENDGGSFDSEVIDPRVGAIDAPLVDLNGDGRLDIVVLFSQHHETVVAFLNDGKGWFVKRTIYQAPHPDWGSSGIEVTDIDADGDLDVVFVCGDTLDTGVLHRHQGVYLLENRGAYPFVARRIAAHVGAHKVRAADLDGDGDLDLAASSFLPQTRQTGRPVKPLDSVIWIEQTDRGVFVPHPLEAIRCDHAALELGDFDGDGDIDIAVGTFLQGPRSETVDWLTLFENPGR